MVRGGVRPQRRKLVWATDLFSNVTVGAGAKLPQRDLLAGLEVAGSSVLGATIMRTHMQLAMTSAGVLVNPPGVFVGFIVNSAPTVTNLDPGVSFYDDWMLNTSFSPSTNVPGNTTLVDAASATLFWGVRIDLRSKRRIEEMGEKYWFTLSNTGAASIAVSGMTKTLLALP